MEKIGLLLAVTTLPMSLFFTVANVTGGNWLNKFLARLLGIMGVVLSIIYILKYNNLI
jgi:hypothetical protein